MISIDGLTVEFSGTTLFKDISFTIGDKDRIALMGKNGAGKSTLLKIIAGVRSATRGRVTVGEGGKVGYLPQHLQVEDGRTLVEEASRAFEHLFEIERRIAALNEQLTTRTDYESESYMRLIEEVTAISEKFYAVDLTNYQEDVERILLGLGFERSEFTRQTSEFSGGWRNRLALARCLINPAQLLLLDEPTNGLDPSGIHEMRELIKSLPEKYGITLMVSSHLLAEIEQIADNVGIISNGKMIYQDSLYDLQSKTKRELLLRTSNELLAYQLLIPKYEHAGLVHPIQQTKEGLLLPYEGDRSLGLHIRHLFENGIDLYRIEERRGNLEDIYLQMVQKEASL